jgi:hypothetical protein
MAMCMNVKNQQPKHGLTTEEMFPYAAIVLDAPTNWAVANAAYTVRSTLDFEAMRSKHRTIEQLWTLCAGIQEADAAGATSAPAAVRLQYLHCTSHPPLWVLMESLGDFQLSMGLTREALGSFSKFDNWDKMLVCYQLMEQDSKVRSPLPLTVVICGPAT